MKQPGNKNPVGPVVYFGLYDLGKPRNRLMIASLRRVGIDVTEIHSDIWSGIEDKSDTGIWQRLVLGFRMFSAYPGLILRYARAPRHQTVIVGYPAIIDAIVIWPFAKMRGAKIVMDAFMSIYDTVVVDRMLLRPKNLLAQMIKSIEALSCRAADMVVLDTWTHAQYFGKLHRVSEKKLFSVMVGAEDAMFRRLPPRERNPGTTTVLFYGQFIPLHGVDTIVAAARLARDRDVDIDWIVIGTGQEADKVDSDLAIDPVPRLKRVIWLPYERLRDELAKADIALGIFGDTGKAARVIPNKVFQILSVGRPLVTRDSPAIRELVPTGAAGVRLVSPADAEALLAAIESLAASGEVSPQSVTDTYAIERLGHCWQVLIAQLMQT